MEKKIGILIIGFLLSVLLIGCTAQQQAPQQSTVGTESDVTDTQQETTTPTAVQETQTETETQETTTETTPAKTEESSYSFEALPIEQQRKIKMIRTLMDTARKADENYFYRYTAPGLAQTDVWVKGNVMKRSILRLDEVDKYHTYNMVYLYADTLKAEGYCETTKSACPAGKGPFKEDYSKRDLKTPKDWLAELDNNFTWTLDNKIADQLYHIIDYKKDGKTIRVYINNYKGWPGRVEVYGSTNVDSLPKGSGESYIYDDMDIGGVSDDEVTPGEGR